jgi:hypothetical protein
MEQAPQAPRLLQVAGRDPAAATTVECRVGALQRCSLAAGNRR